MQVYVRTYTVISVCIAIQTMPVLLVGRNQLTTGVHKPPADTLIHVKHVGTRAWTLTSVLIPEYCGSAYLSSPTNVQRWSQYMLSSTPI